MSADVQRYEAALLTDSALCERIPATLPAAPKGQECAICTSRENAEQAVCRAIALANARGEFWRTVISE